MIRPIRLLFALCIMLAMPVAAEEMRSVPVRFAPGATGAEITDRIAGYDSVLYRLGAEAGQRMEVGLAPSNLATYFNVYPPGSGPGDQALADGQFTDPPNRWTGTLPASGMYTISVYMMRSAARRDEVSDYTISFRIDGALPETVGGDFADGLMGGPDFWRVRTASGGRLNMRAGPSGATAVIRQVSNGEPLRNLGCRMAEGRRWCEVAMVALPDQRGWVAGDYLIEGDGLAVSVAPSGAEEACLARVTLVTNNGEVIVVRSLFSEAGTEVIVGVGPDKAPWQCIYYSDGTTTEPVSLTDEGRL